MSLDGHRYFLDVDPDGMRLRVECPWAGGRENFTNRVCWPHDLDGEADPAPQPDCTYESWVDELDWTEILRGTFTAELGCEAVWRAGVLELHLTRTPHTWITTRIEQPELPPSLERETETIQASILGTCGP